MTAINPINVNTQGIGGTWGFGLQQRTEEKPQEKADLSSNLSQNRQVSSDATYAFLNAQGAAFVPTNRLNPAQYVDGASAERIAGFMAQFEDIVATNLGVIAQELPSLSDGASYAVAAGMAEASDVAVGE